MSKNLEVPLNVLARHRFDVTTSTPTCIEAEKQRMDTEVSVVIKRTPAGWEWFTRCANRVTRACTTQRGTQGDLHRAVVQVCLAEGRF